MDRREKLSAEALAELKRREEQTNKMLLSLEYVIMGISTVSFCMMVIAAASAEMELWRRVALDAVGAVIFLVGAIYSVRIEREAGYYECPECGLRYVPSMKACLLAPHVGRSRKMKCPKCGQRAYQKKVLTK